MKIIYENRRKGGEEEGKKEECVKQTSDRTRIVEIRARDQYNRECKNEDRPFWTLRI